MASPSSSTDHDDATVRFLAVFTADTGSFITDFFTLADYQRLLCTCKSILHHAEKKNNNVKHFLLEREIVLLLNGNEHDTLTKRMIDCIRLGHYHVEDDDTGENLESLEDAFGIFCAPEYTNGDSLECIDDKHVVSTSNIATGSSAAPGGCVSRFCQSTKTNLSQQQQRFYIVGNDSDVRGKGGKIRAYCQSCLLGDVCLALRFFALQNICTDMQETWDLSLEWQEDESDDDHQGSSSAAFIVCCFSYQPSHGVVKFLFVGGQHHAQINAKETLQRQWEKEQDEKRAATRAPIASREQQQQSTNHNNDALLFSDDDDDSDDDDGINDRLESPHPETKRQRTNTESRHGLLGSSDDEDESPSL